jgi:hypothetical protein
VGERGFDRRAARATGFRRFDKGGDLRPARPSRPLFQQRGTRVTSELEGLQARAKRRFTNEDERHCAYACLAGCNDLGAIMQGGSPSLRAGGLSSERREAVARYLHRVVRKTAGNIELLLDDEKERACTHVTYEMGPVFTAASGSEKSIDWGVTEVCTDGADFKQGAGHGRVPLGATEQPSTTGKARGKPWALAKQHAGPKRARHIARHNLGTKKQTRRPKRTQASLRAPLRGCREGSGLRRGE